VKTKKKKIFYTVDVWGKRTSYLGDKEESEYDFGSDHSGSIPFKSLVDAKKVAAIGGYEHFKVREHADNMWGDEVFVSKELLGWENRQKELTRKCKLNREIRSKLMEYLAKATKGTVLGKIEFTAGHEWKVEITAEPEVWYRPSYSSRLEWSPRFMIGFYKNGEATEEKSEINILEFKTTSGGIKIKKFREKLGWKMRHSIIGDRADVKEMILARADSLLRIALSIHSTELRPLFHNLSQYVVCIEFNGEAMDLSKKDFEIVTELPENHAKSLKKKEAIKALAKHSEITFSEDKTKYVLKYL